MEREREREAEREVKAQLLFNYTMDKYTVCYLQTTWFLTLTLTACCHEVVELLTASPTQHWATVDPWPSVDPWLLSLGSCWPTSRIHRHSGVGCWCLLRRSESSKTWSHCHREGVQEDLESGGLEPLSPCSGSGRPGGTDTIKGSGRPGTWKTSNHCHHKGFWKTWKTWNLSP